MTFLAYVIVFIVTTIVSVALAPKPPKPKPSLLEDFDFPVAEEGRPVPVIFGTMRVTGANVLWYGDLGTKPIKKSSMFSSQTIGYQYYMGVHFGLSHGGLDALTKIEIGDKEAWTGSVTANGSFDINQPKLFGGKKREGGIVGTVDVLLGASTQPANGYLTAQIGTPMPAFRDLTTFVFRNTTANAIITGKTGGYIGTATYPKPWAFTGRRILTGWNGGTAWYSAKAAIGTSMNPAHVLYQCLTDSEWGMGQPTTSLDDTTWMAGADQFYTEGFGLDLLWNQTSSIEDFVVAVLDHVGGLLRFNHSTDKLELKLVRDDYVHGDLELFDEDDIRAVKRCQRQAWGETVNEITLRYTDPTTRKVTSITVHDLGNIRSQGELIGEVVDYPGVTSHAIAKRCAQRELAARSTPLSQCTLEMTRAFWSYSKGDVFRLNWSPHGIADVVFRVINVKGGTLQDSIIEVECIEDIFGLPTASYVAVSAPGSAPTDATFDPLDDVTGASVASATTTAPPGSPTDGAKYLVPTGATGAWSGHVGELAIWDAEDAAWIFETVSAGTVVTAVDTGSQVQSVGSGSPAVSYTPIQTTGKVAFTTDITPTTLAANTNDYAPTGLSTASTLRLSASAAYNLTGLTGGEDGRILLLHNVGSFTITLKDENAGSTAANRFALSADVQLVPDTSTMLQWDATSSRWRVIGGSGVSPTTTLGDLIKRGASVDTRLPIGTTGQVLTVVGGEPAWLAASTGAVLSDAPARLWFGPSGVTIELFSSQAGGDPHLVWDGSQWVMFYWKTVTGSPYVRCYYRTAPTLRGTWSSATEITAMQSYHKPWILVDEYGAPVLLSGSYHAYATYYNNTLASKEIFHFTASTLTGTWTLGSKVVAKGGSGDKDELNTDTPFAIYKDGTIYLWYMGAPNSSLPTYGYAIRILRATATDPNGAFTKSTTDVILPSSSAAWDYGWLGGVQILRRPGGGYMMVFNAGDTRPPTPGSEPNVSRVGYAYADSIDGPWSKDTANPYFTPTGWPANGLESVNVWRCCLAYDKALDSWFAFYNTGSSSGAGELITYGIAGAYDYFDETGGSPYNILTLTTGVQTITNSRVNVTPGVYRVRYAYNVGDLGITKPALDVDLTLRLDGSTAKPASREFVGSYNYENRDVILEYIIPVKQSGYFDATVQVTGGTPTANSRIRRGRITVERIRAS